MVLAAEHMDRVISKKLRMVVVFVCMACTAFASGLQSKPSYTHQSLNQVLSEAMSVNPNTLKALHEKREAQLRASQALHQFGPSVDLSYTLGSRQDNTLTDGNGNDNPNAHYYNLQWSLRQSLFSGFSTLNTLKQTRSEALASVSLLAASQSQTAATIIQAYIDLYKRRRLLELSLQNVANHRKTLVKAKKRFRAGASDSSDVELAHARLAKAQADLAQTRRMLREAGVEFTRATGRGVPRRLSLPQPPSQTLPHSLNEALDQAFLNNPMLQAERHNLKAKRYGVAIQQSAYYPNVSLNLSDARSRHVSSFDGVAVDKRANIMIQYNLFNSGVDMKNVQISKQQLRQSEQTYAGVIRLIRANVTSMWSRILAAKENHKALIHEVEADQDVVRSYTRQFQMGKRSLINVLDMESELYRARTRLVDNDMTMMSDYYALLSEMGTLFEGLARQT